MSLSRCCFSRELIAGLVDLCCQLQGMKHGLMTSYYVGPEAEDRESLFLMTTELKNETDLTI